MSNYNFGFRVPFLFLFIFISASCSFSASRTPGSSNQTTSAPSPTPTPDNPASVPNEPPPVVVDPLPTPLPPLPSQDLERENIGTKTRVYNLFDRWKLKGTVTGGRGSQYADVTVSCHGKIDLDYALTAEQWKDRTQKSAYYRNVGALIEKVGAQLLSDRGNILSGSERENFLKALKALAWQESGWQHYVRYKDWFFVILSGGSYNVLDDWGITQVARSGFSAGDLLNPGFFSSGKYCGIASTLYYGFTEYYDNYMEARSLSCNQTGNALDKLLGAYNRYSSGYSACVNGLSNDSAYRSYQINAMNGIKSHYLSSPWLNQMNLN